MKGKKSMSNKEFEKNVKQLAYLQAEMQHAKVLEDHLAGHWLSIIAEMGDEFKKRGIATPLPEGYDLHDTKSISKYGEPEAVLTTEEARKYLRISRPTFSKYIQEGRINARIVGKGYKILQSELDKFLRGK